MISISTTSASVLRPVAAAKSPKKRMYREARVEYAGNKIISLLLTLGATSDATAVPRSEVRRLAKGANGVGDTGLIDYILKRATNFHMRRLVSEPEGRIVVYVDTEWVSGVCRKNGVDADAVMHLMFMMNRNNSARGVDSADLC